MEDFEKFKHLLEYFVAHLEYVVNEDEGMLGYDTYIKPLVEKSTFKKQGQGYNGQSIQNQIEKWESYSNGYDILINIYAASASPYQNKACYLNWEDTWVNVRPNWKNGHIIELYLTKEEKSDANSEETRTIKELGLFDNTSPNDVLKDFFNKYKKLLDNYISKQNEKNMNEQIQKYVNLLKSNHNLILTGAPGTGKTYLAKQIAEAMGCTENEIGFVQFHPSYDYTDFVEGLRPKDDSGNIGFEHRDGVFKEFCTRALKNNTVTNNFDDVFDTFLNDIRDNENFLELNTPSGSKFYVSVNQRRSLTFYTGQENKVGGSLTRKGVKTEYEGKPFYKYWLGYYNGVINYMKAKYNLHSVTEDKKKNFVFIIDEINRGEISKIFGELFFTIDPGYRGEDGKVRTQYANMQTEPNDFDDALGINDPDNCGHFFIPENVYIIGTMNDIDRSVESMDFAFRRRFAFVEVKASENTGMLEDKTWKDEAIKRMNSLNAEIEKIEGLSSAYHIGASYFLKLDNYNNEFEKLWEYHLEGLLREYLRGMQNVDELIVKLKNAYDLKAGVDDSNSNN